jgi:hypothetical protein
MRNRRTWVDVVGPVLGVVAIGMVAFSLVYLLSIRPFYRGVSYDGARSTIGGAGWASAEGTESFSQGFTRLEVKNVSGPVRVEGGSEGSIQVSYLKRARSQSALVEFEIRMQPQGSTLVIQPIYGPPSRGLFGSVDFEIRVPSSVREIKVANVSGRIELENMSGEIGQELETVSGRITTEMAGSLRAKSVSGSIEFASTGDRIDVNSTSGRIKGQVLSLGSGGAVDIESISGRVELEAFGGLDAAVTLQSVSGSINCDFPLQITEQRRNRLEGVIGGGTVPFRVKTVSGGIQLARME